MFWNDVWMTCYKMVLGSKYKTNIIGRSSNVCKVLNYLLMYWMSCFIFWSNFVHLHVFEAQTKQTKKKWNWIFRSKTCFIPFTYLRPRYLHAHRKMNSCWRIFFPSQKNRFHTKTFQTIHPIFFQVLLKSVWAVIVI